MPEVPSFRARRRVRLELEGLIAVHAVRAVWTALGAVPGIVSAEVSMAGAVLDVEEPFDRDALERALVPALDAAGIRLVRLDVESPRMLPLA